MPTISSTGQLLKIEYSSVNLALPNNGNMALKIVKPQCYEPHPVVLLLMGMHGVTPSLCSVGRLIAEAGYAVVIPNFYHAITRQPTYRPKNFDEALDAMYLLSDKQAVIELGLTLDFLSTRKDFDASCVSLVGHCLGARLGLLAATRYARKLRCVVSYYASGMPSSWLTQAMPSIPLQIVSCAKGLFASTDVFEQFANRVEGQSASVSVCRYGNARHNFLDARDKYYNPLVAADALHKTFAFLSANTRTD